MWLTYVGAAFQIIILVLERWFESRDEKKEQIKELEDDFKEAIRNRDYAYMHILWNRAKLLRQK